MLVATDVAARGVHVDDVELVVHVDPPAEHKAYLHRSGRTARAGSEGDVVTVVLPGQKRDVEQLLRKAAITVTPQQVTRESAAVVGARRRGRRVREARSPRRAQQQGGGGRSQGANAQRKRANRDERTGGTDAAARPRRDRLRPSGRAGLRSGRSRSSEQGQGRSRLRRCDRRIGSLRAAAVGTGGGRSGSGRSGGLTVGSVAALRTRRAAAARRAQG